jgi:RNA polymerase sigma-70 factor, ECF subfamily
MPDHRARDDDKRLYLLVLRCQTGDETAFSQLMYWFGARTLAHLRGLLGDDSDDVQQEVWLAVYRRIGGLTNPRAFRTWLFQTTRHRAIDFLRSRKRERDLLEDAAHEIEIAHAPDEGIGGLDQSSIAAALGELSPVQREALLLRYQEEMTYAQIAVIVGCSIGTVRSRLHHAKQRLQDAMERIGNRRSEIGNRKSARASEVANG